MSEPVIMRPAHERALEEAELRSLSLRHLRLLALASANPNATASAIAEAMGLSREALSRLASDLVRYKLLKREDVPTDARRVRYALTTTGRSLDRLLAEGMRS